MKLFTLEEANSLLPSVRPIVKSIQRSHRRLRSFQNSAKLAADAAENGGGGMPKGAQYARLLMRLLDENAMTPDSYSLGGVVEQLEEQCARVLGKERAIFMPTGTLANHMAVRALAGGSSRVIVPGHGIKRRVGSSA